MRNYPAFPRATPHQWAGSPRVPHPSATLISEETTFDLHALGTPPALILSQDQTLHQESWCPLTHRFPKVASRVAKFQLFWLRYAAHAVRQIVNSPSGFPEIELPNRPNDVRRRVLMLRLRR